MSDETAVAETEETAVVVDEARSALLEEISGELGDAVVESYVKPGDDIWVRVAREAWAETAHVLREAMGFRFFNFLSAIDWMPSPFGRDMDSQVDLSLNPPEDTPEAQPCLLYTSPSPRDATLSRMPSSA